MAKHNSIDTPHKRKKLEPRREPYWQKVTTGQYVGFRKAETGGTWIARARGADGKQRYHSIGADDSQTYDEALTEALQWFQNVVLAKNHRYTVNQAIGDYIRHLEVNNSQRSARDTEQRLEKHVIPVLGEIPLSKLTTQQIAHCQNRQVRTDGDKEDTRRSKDTANRVLAMLKAALNMAYRNEVVASDGAWRRVKAFRGVTANRKLFLTDQQVQRLLEKTDGGFHELVNAAFLTGGRFGELADAKVKDLDTTNRTLQLNGKTGARECYLSDEAFGYFKGITKDRLPEAHILAKDDGTPWGRSHYQRYMRSAVARARLPRETVFYSLRHYHISKALLAGVPVQVVAENTGTSIRMIEKHYGKFMAADRRAMFNTVELG